MLDEPECPVLPESLSAQEPPVQPAPGVLIADRYTLVESVEVLPDREIFLAVTDPAEKWCPTCQNILTAAGDGVFCDECGTELQPGYYRLTIWPEAVEPPGIKIFAEMGLYDDNWQLPLDSFIWKGRRVLVQENPTGESLKQALPTATRGEIVSWGKTLLEVTQRLHEAGYAGFHPTVDDLIVTDFRRVKLLIWKGFTLFPEDGVDRREEILAAQKKDLSDLASLLTFLLIEENASSDVLRETEVSAPLRAFLSDLATGVFSDAISAVSALETALLPKEIAIPEPVLLPAKLRYIHGGRSDVGKVRTLNEDSLAAVDLSVIRTSDHESLGVYVVADGVGGHDAGEVASRVAVGALVKTLLQTLITEDLDTLAETREDRYAEILSDAVHTANDAVLKARKQHRADLNTTLTAALVVGCWAYVANVGDSRTYLFHDGRLKPITTDHSMVARLVAIGMIKPDEVYTHPQRNVIYRALGDSHDFGVDTYRVRLEPNDRLVLCSDGLWEMTHDPEMEAILGSVSSPIDACDRLVARANTNGGVDNISVIVVHAHSYDE